MKITAISAYTERRISGALSPAAHPRDLAALARQLLEISKELQATKAGGEEDQIGQAAATADEPWHAL